jgi:CBS domain-containing protein
MNRSATARDYMTANPITVGPDLDIHKAIRLLLKHRISGAPVVDGQGNLIGIISKKDCLKVAFRAGYHKERAGPVSDYMSRDVQTVEAGTDIVAVAERFLKGPFRRFPVLADNRLVGQISRHDVLRALEDLW